MPNRLDELVDILTGLMGDLTIAVTVLKEYELKPHIHLPEHAVSRQAIWRLCINSIVMNCCKFEEVTRKYGKEFNESSPEHRSLRSKFIEAIKNNHSFGILRDNYVAHVNGTNSKPCLTSLEVQTHILSVVGSDNAAEFLDWICPDNVEAQKAETSLVGAILLLRDSVAKKL